MEITNRRTQSSAERKTSILIMDTEADQCTIGRPSWIVLNKTGEEIQCNGYLKGEKELYGPTLPVVSAATCATDQEG